MCPGFLKVRFLFRWRLSNESQFPLPGLHSHCFLDFRGIGLEMLQTASDVSLKEWISICTGEQSCDAHASPCIHLLPLQRLQKGWKWHEPDWCHTDTNESSNTGKQVPLANIWSAMKNKMLGTVAHTFNPSPQDAELCWVRGQPGVYSEFQDSQGYVETISQKNIFFF